MGSRPGPIEQATQAPGEIRTIPSRYMDATVAQINVAKRLLDECNGNTGLAMDVLTAVAEGRRNG